MAPDNVQRVVTFDPRGDLRLEVESNPEDPTQPASFQCAFIVCSRALARASPVFATRLYGDNSEARPADGQWVVRLPDDSAEAFAILLNIIHRPWDKHPNMFNGGAPDDQASQCPGDIVVHLVTKLAQKYGLTYVVVPWANHWLSGAEDEVDTEDEEMHEPENPGWSSARLCTGWILGDENLVATQLSQLGRCSYLDEDHELEVGRDDGRDQGGFDGETRKSDRASEVRLILHELQIQETIADRRLKLVKAMLKSLESLITDGLDSQGSWRCSWEPKSPGWQSLREVERRSCDGSVLAGHVQALTELGIYPLKRAYMLSAAELFFKITCSLVERKIKAIRSSAGFGHTHSNCDISPVVIGWRKTMEEAWYQVVDDEYFLYQVMDADLESFPKFPDFTPTQKARIAQQRVQASQSPTGNGF